MRGSDKTFLIANQKKSIIFLQAIDKDLIIKLSGQKTYTEKTLQRKNIFKIKQNRPEQSAKK